MKQYEKGAVRDVITMAARSLAAAETLAALVQASTAAEAATLADIRGDVDRAWAGLATCAAVLRLPPPARPPRLLVVPPTRPS